MKKIIKTLVVVLVVVLAIAAFTACNLIPTPTTPTTPAECEHTGGSATCTEAAVCELCGESYGKALGHKEAFTTPIQPTCTEEGISGKSYCSVCGEVFIEAIVIPANGHEMEEVEGKAPTCQEPGYTAYNKCEVCGFVEGKEDLPVDPDAHTPNATGKCVCGLYALPAAGEAFKLQLVQTNLNKALYFTGAMSGYYFATSENLEDAVDLYIETAEEGFHIYFLDGETKNYLYVEQSGTHINVKYGATQGVWTFNAELGTLVTNVGGTDYYIGTYGTYNTISASKTSFINADNVNKSQYAARPVANPAHECDYTEATCTVKATCKVCGLTTGDLKEHAYDMENGVVTEPTCTAAGYTTYTCADCPATKKVDGDAALGHTTENGVCERCKETIGGDTPAEPITVSKTMAELITANGWTDTTTKQTFKLDDNVTVKIDGGSNTGKAYNGDHIRIYATDTPAGTITISVPEGYELVSVKISAQTGTYAFLYVDGTTTDISNKSVDVSGQSVLLNSVKNGSNGKQVRVTGIEVVYQAK